MLRSQDCLNTMLTGSRSSAASLLVPFSPLLFRNSPLPHKSAPCKSRCRIAPVHELVSVQSGTAVQGAFAGRTSTSAVLRIQSGAHLASAPWRNVINRRRWGRISVSGVPASSKRMRQRACGVLVRRLGAGRWACFAGCAYRR